MPRALRAPTGDSATNKQRHAVQQNHEEHGCQWIRPESQRQRNQIERQGEIVDTQRGIHAHHRKLPFIGDRLSKACYRRFVTLELDECGLREPEGKTQAQEQGEEQDTRNYFWVDMGILRLPF